jgi:hypothetical protein
LPYGTDTLSIKKALMKNAFTLFSGDGYEQLFLRYFVTVKAIILSTNGF